MIELVARKYAQALQSSFSKDGLEEVVQALEGMVVFYENAEFLEVIGSPYYPSHVKEELLESVLEDQDSRLRNFVRLLGEHKRLEILPDIYQELLAWMQREKNTYRGYLHTNQEVSLEQLKRLEQEVSARLQIDLSLKALLEDIEGIKLSIPGLDLEIAFYKDNFFRQLKHHVMEAV